MTLSKNFDPLECPECKGHFIRDQAARPAPWLLQLLFGVSFVAFMVVIDRNWIPTPHRSMVVWGWSAIQIVLGLLLARARIQAKQRIFRCLGCGAIIR